MKECYELDFWKEKYQFDYVWFYAAADVFLWRNKKISASVLGGATAIWVLFELLEYFLVGLVCHLLIFTLAVLFLWSNATTFINKWASNLFCINWFCNLLSHLSETVWCILLTGNVHTSQKFSFRRSQY